MPISLCIVRKSQGKACSELFDRTMHEQVMSRLLLEAKLRYALENEELTLHYQPIVAVDTGAVQGFEALLRWQPSGFEFDTTKHFCPGSRTVRPDCSY